MAGYFEILIYMLCVYFVLKGVEIFQIALVSDGPAGRRGLIVGVIALAAAVIAAGTFFAFTIYYSAEFNQRLQQPQMPPFPR